MTHQLEGREEEATYVEPLLPSHHHAEVYQRKVRLAIAIAIAIAIALALALAIALRTRGGTIGATRHLPKRNTNTKNDATNHRKTLLQDSKQFLGGQLRAHTAYDTYKARDHGRAVQVQLSFEIEKNVFVEAVRVTHDTVAPAMQAP